MIPQINFKISALLAVLTLLVIVTMHFYKKETLPPNQLEYKMAILAFEFARNADEIRTLFVYPNGQLATDFIKKNRQLTWIDFLFIFCYTGFITSFVWQALRQKPSWLNKSAIMIVPLIGLFDILENIQLFNILNIVKHNIHATFQPELSRLAIFTWIKWEATGLFMLLIVPFLWKSNYWLKGISVVGLIVSILGIAALIERLTSIRIVYAQWFTGMIFIVLFLLIGYTIIKYFMSKKPGFTSEQP